jgi:hypothetical protein
LIFYVFSYALRLRAAKLKYLEKVSQAREKKEMACITCFNPGKENTTINQPGIFLPLENTRHRNECPGDTNY